MQIKLSIIIVTESLATQREFDNTNCQYKNISRLEKCTWRLYGDGEQGLSKIVMILTVPFLGDSLTSVETGKYAENTEYALSKMFGNNKKYNLSLSGV